ncbi:MAG: LEPR-XLL domain-containing protein, partial [Verrucomicrobiales bacterium]|nr:LEPR-XLL domain-containing protein [Verrucomicrobiales bacterium]
MSRTRQQPPPHGFELERLEPRVLLSGVPLAEGIGGSAPAESGTSTLVEVERHETAPVDTGVGSIFEGLSPEPLDALPFPDPDPDPTVADVPPPAAPVAPAQETPEPDTVVGTEVPTAVTQPVDPSPTGTPTATATSPGAEPGSGPSMTDLLTGTLRSANGPPEGVASPVTNTDALPFDLSQASLLELAASLGSGAATPQRPLIILPG